MSGIDSCIYIRTSRGHTLALTIKLKIYKYHSEYDECFYLGPEKINQKANEKINCNVLR